MAEGQVRIRAGCSLLLRKAVPEEAERQTLAGARAGAWGRPSCCGSHRLLHNLRGQGHAHPGLADGLPITLRAGGAERSLGSAAERKELLDLDLDPRTLGQHSLWLWLLIMEMIQCQMPKGVLLGCSREPQRQTDPRPGKGVSGHSTHEATPGVTGPFGSGLPRNCSPRGDFTNAPLGIKADLPTVQNWAQPHGQGSTARWQAPCPALAGHGNKLQTGHLWGVCVSTALALWPMGAEPARVAPGSS